MSKVKVNFVLVHLSTRSTLTGETGQAWLGAPFPVFVSSPSISILPSTLASSDLIRLDRDQEHRAQVPVSRGEAWDGQDT